MDTGSRSERAFTLIELLIVIAIIGLLASIILVASNGARSKARYVKALGDMSEIDKAAELYSVNSNTGYPADVGQGFLPPELAPYLTSWPTPPCPGWTYDWENWGFNLPANQYAIRITLRRAGDAAPIYYFCIDTNADCGQALDGGIPIQNVPTKSLTCSE